MNEKNILSLLFKNDKNIPIIEKIEYKINYDKNYEISYNDLEYEFEDDMKKFLIQKIDKENFYKNILIQKENEKEINCNFRIKNENNLYKKFINLDEEYYKYNQKVTHDPFAINLHEILRIPYEIQIRKFNYKNNNDNFIRENNFNRNKHNNYFRKNNSVIYYHNNEFDYNPLINFSNKRNKSSHKKYY